jgi:hypothetical protein
VDCVLTAFSEIGKPAKYRSNIDAKSSSNTRHGFAVTYGLYCLLTHHLKRVMVMGSGVRIPFALHGAILT